MVFDLLVVALKRPSADEVATVDEVRQVVAENLTQHLKWEMREGNSFHESMLDSAERIDKRIRLNVTAEREKKLAERMDGVAESIGRVLKEYRTSEAAHKVNGECSWALSNYKTELEGRLDTKISELEEMRKELKALRDTSDGEVSDGTAGT